MDSLGLRRLRFPFFKSNCQRAGDRNWRCAREPPWKQMPPQESNTTRGISLKKREHARSSFRKFC